MKLPTITLLAVALVVGCSKPAPSGGGTVASNTTASSQGASTTAGTTDTPAGSQASSSAGTAGSTTQPGSGAAPGAAPGSAPGKSGAPMAGGTATGGANMAPGTQPQMTPQQQADMQKRMADAKQKSEENSAKAEKAKPAALSGVTGTYKIAIDESKIPPQFKTSPQYADSIAKAKKTTLTAAANGDVVVKGGAAQSISGFFSNIDGKPAFVFTPPAPPGQKSEKHFVPVTVKSGGSSIMLGAQEFKKD